MMAQFIVYLVGKCKVLVADKTRQKFTYQNLGY